MAYGIESSVVYPPVDLDLFSPAANPSRDYFLIVSALMKYKRIDIAVEAFNQLQLPLIIVGAGEDAQRLRRLAGPTAKFLGALPDRAIAGLYANCRGFIFTADEDFGLTPIEAMASGRPVVAYRAGGALETVVDGVTGTFFEHQSAECLAEVLTSVDFDQYDSAAIRIHAERFSVSAFQQELHREVQQCLGLGRQDRMVN